MFNFDIFAFTSGNIKDGGQRTRNEETFLVKSVNLQTIKIMYAYILLEIQKSKIDVTTVNKTDG